MSGGALQKSDDLATSVDLATEALPYLLRRAHARAENLFIEIMCPEDLTPRQVTLLVATLQQPGATLKELAEEIAVDANTTSAMVRRLVAKGLLRRDRSEVDGRALSLYITPAGEEILDKILPNNKQLGEAILAPLPPEYRPLFLKCIRLMAGVEAPAAEQIE